VSSPADFVIFVSFELCGVKFENGFGGVSDAEVVAGGLFRLLAAG
jgi:hypothetical protein